MSLLLIVDIDGTIAHAGRRFEEAGQEPDKNNKVSYNQWLANVQNEESLLEDKPVAGMGSLVTVLGCLGLVDVVYLTGREEQWRKVTEDWMLKHKFPIFPLEMRPSGDYTENCKFKEAVINRYKYMYKSDEVIVIDDDHSKRIEAMCERNGFTFLKAMSGGVKANEKV